MKNGRLGSVFFRFHFQLKQWVMEVCALHENLCFFVVPPRFVIPKISLSSMKIHLSFPFLCLN